MIFFSVGSVGNCKKVFSPSYLVSNVFKDLNLLFDRYFNFNFLSLLRERDFIIQLPEPIKKKIILNIYFNVDVVLPTSIDDFQ